MKVDISQKNEVLREATATGRIYLKKDTIERIRQKTTKKGDVLQVAEVAGLGAIKQTQLIIPFCHQIPIHNAIFDFSINEDSIDVTATVKTVARTGVEMEALVGISIALNSIWDMVKYLEKDKDGQYPNTRMTDIRVLKKFKGE